MMRRVRIAFGPKPYQRLVLQNTGKRQAIIGVVEKQHLAFRSPWIARLIDGSEIGTFDCEFHAIHYLARCCVVPLRELIDA